MLSASVLFMGSLPTGNAQLTKESPKRTALERAFDRTVSMTHPQEYSSGSFSIRTVMWTATARMIAANPVVGVGAGAWEVHIPTYQANGSSLETDYYAHNEFLQLLAEYGLVGWIFLAGLLAYLLRATYTTLSDSATQARLEAPLRAMALSCLLMLFVVSNAGFPWRLAATGALFALSLSVLAASDLRLYCGENFTSLHVNWKPLHSNLALIGTAMCGSLAVYASQQAVECESKLMHAIKLALTVTRSGKPNDVHWRQAKADIVSLTREGIAINPHYRKLTPIVADSFASWGDWASAIWIWESVLASRPYVVGMISNVARGYIQVGKFDKAEQALGRAKAIEPNAIGLQSLEVQLWSRSGRERAAAQRARELLRSGNVDRDLVQTAYFLATRMDQPDLAIQALEAGIKKWPNRAVDGWLRMASVYSTSRSLDPIKAIACYQAAIDAAPTAYKPSVIEMIPLDYRSKIHQ
jgi:tetratricopeptide (TPR) repeat protein